MNERIKLLAEQAGFAYEPSETLQKFAELIVRQCADLIDNVLEEGSPPNLTMGEQLVKHFGVEE